MGIVVSWQRRSRGVRWIGIALLLGGAGCLDVADGGSPDRRAATVTAAGALTAADVPWTATELVGRPTARAMTVNAIAAIGVTAYVEVGTVSGATDLQTPAADYPTGMIEAVVGGLSPATRYFYRLRYRPIASPDPFLIGPEHTFRTQRTRAETFSFAIQADSHQGFAAFHSSQLYGITMQNVLGESPDFFFDLGDTFSTDDATETEATVRQKYLDQRTFFDIVGHSIPVFLVLGNHENEEGWNLDDFGANRAASLPVLGANARKRYFLNPVPDGFYTGNDDPLPELDGDHLREDYYAFEWGNALFVAIDPFAYTTRKPYAGSTGGEKNDEVVGNRWDWTLGRKQYLWLKQTLETSTAPFKFVFAHHVTGGTQDYGRAGARGAKYCEWGGYNTDGTTWAFDTKRPGWEMPIHQLFVQNHVSAFFHAHDHVYAKEALDGVVYQELPFAANASYDMGFASNATDYAGAQMVANSGHLRVTVAPAEVTVDYVRSFLPGDGANGSVAASYRIGGCGSQDTDGDGTPDCSDGCPADPGKVAPGACGCGTADTDGDGDATPNCNDGCPADPGKIAPGACGCGVADTDSDGDGTPNCHDACPTDAAKTAPGACGCGVADTDANGNGTADCLESCAGGACACSGATLASNDADGTAPIGTPIRWTAGAQCGGGTATYQFRMAGPRGFWRTMRSYGPSNTYDWVTSGLAAGTYRFQVWVRQSGSTKSYEGMASATFVLTRN
jgi:hypothetical protein